MKKNSTSARAAFTLVELLIVMAVVTVIACILFTVFSRQRENARSTQCQGNLSQIFKAMQLYMQDNDSRFPSYKSSEWVTELMPYTKSEAVFRCPTVQSLTTPKFKADYGTYPERVAQFYKSNEGRISHKNAHESQLSSTSDWILMSDIGTGEEPTMHLYDYPNDCSQKLIGNKMLGREFSLIHSGGGNFLFADGHVKWLLPGQAIEADCSAGPFL